MTSLFWSPVACIFLRENLWILRVMRSLNSSNMNFTSWCVWISRLLLFKFWWNKIKNKYVYINYRLFLHNFTKNGSGWDTNLPPQIKYAISGVFSNERLLPIFVMFQYVVVHLDFLHFVLREGVLYLPPKSARMLWSTLISNPDACEWDRNVRATTRYFSYAWHQNLSGQYLL